MDETRSSTQNIIKLDNQTQENKPAGIFKPHCNSTYPHEVESLWMSQAASESKLIQRRIGLRTDGSLGQTWEITPKHREPARTRQVSWSLFLRRRGGKLQQSQVSSHSANAIQHTQSRMVSFQCVPLLLGVSQCKFASCCFYDKIEVNFKGV